MTDIEDSGLDLSAWWFIRESSFSGFDRRGVAGITSLATSNPYGGSGRCGTGGNSANGGSGGYGGSYASNGLNGVVPGGGGGGGGANYIGSYDPQMYSGGSGASGEIVLTYATTTAPLVTQTITSSPAGLLVLVDLGTPQQWTCPATPCSAQWYTGTNHTVAIATQIGPGGVQYLFSNWADDPSQTATRTIIAPAAASTYTAVMTAGPGDFSISAAPSSRTVTPGGRTTFPVSIGALSGFGGSVSISASGLPAGVTASYSPVTVTGGAGTSVVTISTTSATPAGSITITITGTTGVPGDPNFKSHSASVTVVVSSAADFTISTGPGQQSGVVGSSATFTVTIGAVNNFGDAVDLSASGLPAGATATFTPVTGAGTSTLTISTSATSTPVGSSQITVTGNAGSLSHAAAPVTLTVATQVISFLPFNGPVTLDKGTIILTATVSSGPPIAYSATGSACSVSGATATLLAVGQCTITATQPGGTAAPAWQVLTVAAVLTVQTRASYSSFTAASRLAGTVTITATASGGSNPSGRAYSWAGGSFGSAAQYSMPAPSANTTVVLAVSDGASTVTKNVTVRPSPAISDATVVEMVLGKAISLNDFAAHLGAGANSAFFKSRLKSLTGVADAQAQTLLADSGQYKAHAMSRSQIAPDLAPVSANTAWTTMAQYFTEDCGDFDCGCDPQVGECDVCPPDCGIGSAPPPDPTPGLSVVGVAWAPEIDPQTGTASGVVDAVLQNPYGLQILSGHVSSTVSLTPGGAATNTVTANYTDLRSRRLTPRMNRRRRRLIQRRVSMSWWICRSWTLTGNLIPEGRKRGTSLRRRLRGVRTPLRRYRA